MHTYKANSPQSEATTSGQQAATQAEIPLAPSGRIALSACVVTFDEADRIGRCLASLAFCSDVLVVDSHSLDATRDIALAAGARVIERDWPGYRAQKQFAIEQAQHDWVLVLDADEVVSPVLAAEIQARWHRGFDDVAAFSMPRCTEYFGRMIRHGAWYPDRVLRLLDRRRARFAGREIHERVDVDGRVEPLSGDLLHFAYRNLADQLGRLERYAELMARALHAEGRRARAWNLFFSPTWRWFRDLVLKGGWRDGWRGFAIAGIEANYVRQKYLKLWLLNRGLPISQADRARA